MFIVQINTKFVDNFSILIFLLSFEWIKLRAFTSLHQNFRRGIKYSSIWNTLIGCPILTQKFDT